MNRLRHPMAQGSAHLALQKITFRIVHHPWSVVVQMLHEMNMDAQTLKEALSVGHGIEFDADTDPELYFVLDSEMRQKLYDSNFRDPTEAQLIATSRCVGLSERSCPNFRNVVYTIGNVPQDQAGQSEGGAA